MRQVSTEAEKNLFENLYRQLVLRGLRGQQLFNEMARQWEAKVMSMAVTGAKLNIRPKTVKHLQRYAELLSKQWEDSSASMNRLSGSHAKRDPQRLALRRELMAPLAPPVPLVPPQLATAPSIALVDPSMLPPPVPRMAQVDLAALERLVQPQPQKEVRGPQMCSKCGQPRKGHKCLYP